MVLQNLPASLDPFKMVLKSEFDILELFVDNDTIKNRDNRSNQVVSLEPLKLLADVDIEAKSLNFRPTQLFGVMEASFR